MPFPRSLFRNLWYVAPSTKCQNKILHWPSYASISFIKVLPCSNAVRLHAVCFQFSHGTFRSDYEAKELCTGQATLSTSSFTARLSACTMQQSTVNFKLLRWWYYSAHNIDFLQMQGRSEDWVTSEDQYIGMKFKGLKTRKSQIVSSPSDMTWMLDQTRLMLNVDEWFDKGRARFVPETTCCHLN